MRFKTVSSRVEADFDAVHDQWCVRWPDGEEVFLTDRLFWTLFEAEDDLEIQTRVFHNGIDCHVQVTHTASSHVVTAAGASRDEETLVRTARQQMKDWLNGGSSQ